MRQRPLQSRTGLLDRARAREGSATRADLDGACFIRRAAAGRDWPPPCCVGATQRRGPGGTGTPIALG